MSIRRRKILLWLASTVLVAAAALAIVGARLLPYDRLINAHPTAKIHDLSSNAAQTVVALADIPIIDLRRALTDTPQGSATKQLPPPPSLKLAGTAYEEHGRCYAFFFTPDGRQAMKRVGDSIDGAKIIEIHEGTVLVRYNGADITLRIVKGG